MAERPPADRYGCSCATAAAHAALVARVDASQALEEARTAERSARTTEALRRAVVATGNGAVPT